MKPMFTAEDVIDAYKRLGVSPRYGEFGATIDDDGRVAAQDQCCPLTAMACGGKASVPDIETYDPSDLVMIIMQDRFPDMDLFAFYDAFDRICMGRFVGRERPETVLASKVFQALQTEKLL